jgi:hypothetical protein
VALVETIAKATLQLACCMEKAEFADPDEAQGAAEVVGWCLAEASSKGAQGLLRLIAAEEVSRLRLEDGREKTLKALKFYRRFIG